MDESASTSVGNRNPAGTEQLVLTSHITHRGEIVFRLLPILSKNKSLEVPVSYVDLVSEGLLSKALNEGFKVELLRLIITTKDRRFIRPLIQLQAELSHISHGVDLAADINHALYILENRKDIIDNTRSLLIDGLSQRPEKHDILVSIRTLQAIGELSDIPLLLKYLKSQYQVVNWVSTAIHGIGSRNSSQASCFLVKDVDFNELAYLADLILTFRYSFYSRTELPLPQWLNKEYEEIIQRTRSASAEYRILALLAASGFPCDLDCKKKMDPFVNKAIDLDTALPEEKTAFELYKIGIKLAEHGKC